MSLGFIYKVHAERASPDVCDRLHNKELGLEWYRAGVRPSLVSVHFLTQGCDSASTAVVG